MNIDIKKIKRPFYITCKECNKGIYINDLNYESYNFNNILCRKCEK